MDPMGYSTYYYNSLTWTPNTYWPIVPLFTFSVEFESGEWISVNNKNDTYVTFRYHGCVIGILTLDIQGHLLRRYLDH